MHLSCQGFPLFCPLIHHPHRICHLHKCYQRDHDIVVKVIIIVILRLKRKCEGRLNQQSLLSSPSKSQKERNFQGRLHPQSSIYIITKNHKIFKGGFIHNYGYIMVIEITTTTKIKGGFIHDHQYIFSKKNSREASSTITESSSALQLRYLQVNNQKTVCLQVSIFSNSVKCVK